MEHRISSYEIISEVKKAFKIIFLYWLIIILKVILVKSG